jgi:hypothetical protein
MLRDRRSIYASDWCYLGKGPTELLVHSFGGSRTTAEHFPKRHEFCEERGFGVWLWLIMGRMDGQGGFRDIQHRQHS